MRALDCLISCVKEVHERRDEKMTVGARILMIAVTICRITCADIDGTGKATVVSRREAG